MRLTKEKLTAIKEGARRWHSVSADVTLVLISEIERLHRELEESKRLNRVRAYRAERI
jgi:hypothetical protein